MTDNSWEEAVKGVKPLKNKNKYIEEITQKEVEIKKNKVETVVFDILKLGKGVKKDDLTQMDGRLQKKFKKEEIEIEATLDLHGVVEKTAYKKVCDFICTAYNQGKRCVLIITGKGYDNELFSSRGVLRMSVPLWLEKEDIGSLILAYKNPSEALGGKGALYILLRKNNKVH
ncbi:MAG: Smr/MutS family protein [Alphaproteobacteria bacterium]|nr:Smr/MutS family protein [Alphaproteobacteria bacterium]